MATFLAVPMKATYDVDLIKPIKSFIQSTYSNIGAADYEKGLQEFSRLRSSMISKSADKHESALEVFFRYILSSFALLNLLNF